MGFALRDTTGQSHQIDNILRIGRDPANQIVLQDQKASRLHCTLVENQGILTLRDENSSNGTFVNQTQIHGTATLQPGDVIEIGDTTYIVEKTLEQVIVPPLSSVSPFPPQNIPLPSIVNSPPAVYIPQGPVVNPPPATYVPPAPAVNYPQLVKKKGGINPIIPLIFIILMSLVCIAPAVVGYVYYKAPQAEKNKMLNLIGKGPATIQMENFSDNTVYVFTTTTLDRTVGDDSYAEFEWETSAYGTNSITDQKAGVYRIDFGSQAGGLDLGTCIFNLKGGEVYHFVVIPDLIFIDRTEYPKNTEPDSVTELDMATSSLCQYRSN